MTPPALLQQQLMELLNERRIVVWYDGECAFGHSSNHSKLLPVLSSL
jgi:hypothetical protein